MIDNEVIEHFQPAFNEFIRELKKRKGIKMTKLCPVCKEETSEDNMLCDLCQLGDY